MEIQVLKESIGINFKRFDLKELNYLAFTGQYDLVYHDFKQIDPSQRKISGDKDIFSQVIWAGIEKIRKFKSTHNEEAIVSEKNFIDEIIRQFIDCSKEKNIYSRELFKSVLYWSDELITLAYIEEAKDYINEIQLLGSNKFPDINLHLLSRLALIYARKGNLELADKILTQFVERPYLLTEKNIIPQILFNLSQIALKSGEVEYYKKLLFLGLRHFYSDVDYRNQFTGQISRSYKRAYKVLLTREISISNKILFLVHWLYYKKPDFSKIRLGWINIISKYFVLGYVFLFNYIRRNESDLLKSVVKENRAIRIVDYKGNNGIDLSLLNKDKILITRAMGGIGDLLMMTPGIHALKKKFPHKKICLAIPKRYFAVFKNNPDVTLVDIEEAPINFLSYYKFYNFTDCPASRSESRKSPRIKKNRIEIFAKAFGINVLSRYLMDRRPKYYLTEEEITLANNFWERFNLNSKQVVGIQLHSEEVYRDYPFMKALVNRLAQKYKVLVFDSIPIDGFNSENIFKIDSFTIREAFSLAAKCSLIVAPDSSFIHFAGAMNIPALGIFGPIDGKVRTKDYPKVKFIDVREELGCLPCWRNDNIACQLTNMRSSACLETIPINRIIQEVNKILI
ncbi:MAG: glycosyltransferase family 9 protein [Ignavibacteriales bacterium]|nr:glycosyltransferase family 9 protein [Ignavibacteriales bacterium]